MGWERLAQFCGLFFFVEGDDAEFHVPVVLALEAVDIPGVAEHPCGFGGEADGIVELFQELQNFEGHTVFALEFVKFVGESAPLDWATRHEPRCELIFEVTGEKADDFFRVDAFDFFGEVGLFGFTEAALELREAVDAAEGAIAVGVEGDGQTAIGDFVCPTRAAVTGRAFHVVSSFVVVSSDECASRPRPALCMDAPAVA